VKTLMTKSIVLTFALALAGAACGDSGSTDGSTATDTATATDTTAATDSTAATTDTSPEVEVVEGCFREGLRPGGEYFMVYEIDTFLYGWQTFDRADGSNMSAILRERDGVQPPTTPGTYTLGASAAERDLRTCRTCVTTVAECASPQGCKTFLATSGTLEVTTLDISGLRMAGRLTDVELKELDANGALLANGRTWCIDDLTFDTQPECTTDADCAEKVGATHCVPGWGKCGACADDFDCAAAATPLCRVDAADGSIGCRGPLPDCNNNDAGEPDDGPAVARLVPSGTTLDAVICTPKDAVDWYRFALDDDTNITPTVTWQGQGFLAYSLYGEAGEVITEVYWYELVEGKNLARTLVTALPAGTYYLAVRLLDDVTFAVPYTVSLATEPACASHDDCPGGWCAAGTCRPEAACDATLPALIHQRFIPLATNFFFWRGETAFDYSGSFLLLTLGSYTATQSPVPEVPGTYPLGLELNPRTCQRCLQVLRCDAAGCKQYFAVEGALEVDTWDPAVPVFTGRLVDLKLVELGNTGTVLVDGKVACADEVTIDTRSICESAADCGGRACLVTQGGTGACVDCQKHDDCSGERDLCSPASLSCVECLTSLDCRTAPVCVAGTCSVVEECVGDDASEPLDDGRLGASNVALDQTVQRRLCGLEGTVSEHESDWFSHTATGVGLRDFSVRWTGAATVTAVLYNPNGIEVGRETSSTGATIVRRSVTPGTWLLEVKTLDVPPATPISYNVKVSRP